MLVSLSKVTIMQTTRTSKKANADCARHLPKHDLKDWLASARTLLEREQAELAILEPALRPESFHSDGLPLSLHPRELKRGIEEPKAVIKIAETDAEVLKAVKLNEQILGVESDLCVKTGESNSLT